MGEDFTRADMGALYFVCFLFLPICLVIQFKRPAALAAIGLVAGLAYRLAA